MPLENPEFGPFRIDLPNHRLLRNGELVQLPPKAFDLLCLLAANRDRVVSKDEAMEALWPGTFVEEANLSVNISTLRKALGEPGYIETVPKRGYRLVGTEQGMHAADPVNVPDAAPEFPDVKKKPGVFLLALTVLFVAGVVFVAFRYRHSPPSAPQLRSVAILPFKQLGTAGAEEGLQLGMADAVITKLTNVKRIIVRPTSAIIRYASSSADPLRAGRELAVDGVLDGHLQRAGDKVRVTVQLFRVSDGASLWAGTFDEDFRNIFDVQDTISERVASALTTHLTRSDRAALGRRYTENADAFQLYSIGRYHWYKWTEEEWHKALDSFERAAATDPDYALAYAGIADAYGVLAFSDSPSVMFPKSRDAAVKALQLEPELVEARTSLAAIHLFHDWNVTTCRQELQRALEINPNYALAHDLEGMRLQAAGHPDEAVTEAQRALAIEPSSVYLNWDLGVALYMAGKNEEAATQLKKAIDLDPHFAPSRDSLGMVYELTGRKDLAINEYSAALEGEPESALASLKQAYRNKGWEGFWRERSRQLTERASQHYVSPYLMAQAAVRQGDLDAAFELLGKAIDERSPEITYLNVEPFLAPLRADRRFIEIRRRVDSQRRP